MHWLRKTVIVAVSIPAVVAPACGGGGESTSRKQAPGTIDPADYAANVDHPLFPLSSVRLMIFKGTERDPDTGKTIETRAVSRVLRKSGRVAGVPVAVVDVKEYEDGELVEHTTDYYAQHRDVSVRYFGERVDDYEGGKIAGHEGQWIAGERRANPGLFVPAKPTLGQVSEQERAPGVAEDRSTVVAVARDVTTRAGRFADCIKTKDFSPLDKRTAFKYYCPGVGIVREDEAGGRLQLVRYR